MTSPKLSTSELAAQFLRSHTRDHGGTLTAVEHVDPRRPSAYLAEQVAVQDYLQTLVDAGEREQRFEVPDEPEEIPVCVLRGEKGRFFGGFHPKRKHALVIHDVHLAMLVPTTEAPGLIERLREDDLVFVIGTAPGPRGSL